jgi:hypothetical protein
MSADRHRRTALGSVPEILESRWSEGQSHLANAGVELLLALRAAVSVPIDTAALGASGKEEEDQATAAGWRILRDVINTAIERLKKLGKDPSQAVRMETLSAVQEALAKELERLEQGATGQDVAILVQTFRSVKAIIDRQVELLGASPRKKTRSPRRARKVKVE